jgi:hypothetical protein
MKEMPYEDLVEYVEYLEEKLLGLEAYIKKLENAEVSVEPGAEARGVAWADLYGKTSGIDGQTKLVKISLTSRSDIGPTDALDKLMKAVKTAKEQYKLSM